MEWTTSALALLFFAWSGVNAISVTIPQSEYEVARGKNVTLPCTFTTTNPNPPQAVITWSIQNPTTGADEDIILTYYYPSDNTDIPSEFEGRLSFSGDFTKGKADLKISSITLKENRKFECRLQIPKDDKGKPAAVTRVVVLVAPTKPICKIQGTTEYGQNINLTCYSEEGSPPPNYKWDSYNVQNQNRPLPPRATDKAGILSLYNISKDTSGFYICTSSNKIGSDFCNMTLVVMPPSMNIGSTGGIIGGVLAFLLLIIIIIVACCYCRKKNNSEEKNAKTFQGATYQQPDSVDGQENTENTGEPRVTIMDPGEQRDNYDERSERSYDRKDRRSDYDDRRSDYDDRRSDYDDRRSDYDDRRTGYDDRRRDDRHRDDRRRDYDDRRSDYDDHDGRERYDDDRYYDDRRDRR